MSTPVQFLFSRVDSTGLKESADLPTRMRIRGNCDDRWVELKTSIIIMANERHVWGTEYVIFGNQNFVQAGYRACAVYERRHRAFSSEQMYNGETFGAPRGI